MNPYQYLVLAYGFIFLVLAVYLLLLGRRLTRLQGMLREMRRRVGDE